MALRDETTVQKFPRLEMAAAGEVDWASWGPLAMFKGTPPQGLPAGSMRTLDEAKEE